MVAIGIPDVLELTIESSDRILVMRKGRLIEQGTHKELRALGGLYSQLADLQERGLTKL